MTRSILTLIAVGAVGSVLGGQGCKATGIGDPCIPEQEYNQDFKGFDEQEVNVESKSFQCQTRLCLVNHFRGRVSCPYGQDTSANAPAGAPAPNDKGCTVPGDSNAKIDQIKDPKSALAIQAQCTDRKTDKAVYCSCRCQNADGNTNDGPTYCTCPDGYTCTQLVTPIGSSNEGLTGGYCIKNATQYDRNNACAQSCDPNTAKCD